MTGWLRAALHEPLVHFLIAGAAVFAVFSNVPPDPGERRIVIDETGVARLVENWIAAYHRAPSPAELDGLIGDAVKDQVYYREAQRLGLDREDELVIRRMRTKMQAIAAAEADSARPTEADLQAWLDRDPARYAASPATSFEQVWLGPDRPDVRAAAGAALARLRAGAAADTIGQPVALPARLDGADAAEIGERFGDEFVAALAGLPVGRWSGPVGSGVGLHLVRVIARAAPAPPTLAKVRQRVENDWRADRVARAEAAAYARMLKGYAVVIQRPE